MNKSELVAAVAGISGLTKGDAEIAIEATFASITESLKSGNDVRLVGFGTFVVVDRPETEGRNPRTGEKLTIAATRVPKFRAGKQLKEAVAP
jgi:DNA-binding protein HU-beta